ncbi:MAG TPA: prenyltransferase/squalene oxidase repeat-containing protein [Symbiobacteriaceae bacterium]|jgi:hypothetical protein
MALVELPAIKVDEEGARAFVLAHGGPLDRARVAGVFGAVGPDRDVVRSLEARQNPDGHFGTDSSPDGPGEGSGSLAATADMLALLKDLPPLAGSPMASRALAFLRRRQRVDGAWAELPEAPAGDPALTARVAYTLLTMEPESINPVARGSAWLRTALSAESAGGRASALTLARAWGVWYKILGPRSHEPLWVLDQLRRRELDPAELVGWLNCALEMDAGGRLLLPLAKDLARLAGLQQADGAWPGGVEPTLAALRVLRGYGIFQSRSTEG